MVSSQSTVAFITDQLSEAGTVRSRKMFGEYALYCNEKVVALVCDDQLFVKPTISGRAFIGTVTEASPYPGAKPHFLIDEEFWIDKEWLSNLIQKTAMELPMPRKK